jgi:hypothetical protein
MVVDNEDRSAVAENEDTVEMLHTMVSGDASDDAEREAINRAVESEKQHARRAERSERLLRKIIRKQKKRTGSPLSNVIPISSLSDNDANLLESIVTKPHSCETLTKPCRSFGWLLLMGLCGGFILGAMWNRSTMKEKFIRAWKKRKEKIASLVVSEFACNHPSFAKPRRRKEDAALIILCFTESADEDEHSRGMGQVYQQGIGQEE